MWVGARKHVRNDGARRFNSPPSTLSWFYRPKEIVGFVRYCVELYLLKPQLAVQRPDRFDHSRAWHMAELWLCA
jgi:hypothetical protein